jgi:hypothetical protein
VLLGWLFDRKQTWRKQLYVLSTVISFAFYCCIPAGVLFLETDAFAMTIVCVMLAAAISSASGNLLDAIAVETTKQNEYGKLRLFGGVIFV